MAPSTSTTQPTIVSTKWGNIVVFIDNNWNEFKESCLLALAVAKAIDIVKNIEGSPDPFDNDFIEALLGDYKRRRGYAIAILNAGVSTIYHSSFIEHINNLDIASMWIALEKHDNSAHPQFVAEVAKMFVLNADQTLKQALLTFSACEKLVTAIAVYANTRGKGRGCGGRGRGGRGRGYNSSDRGGSSNHRDYTIGTGGIGKDQCRFCYKNNHHQKDCRAYAKAIALARGKKGKKEKDDNDDETEACVVEAEQYNDTVYSGSVITYIINQSFEIDIGYLTLQDNEEGDLEESNAELAHKRLGHLNYDQMEKLKRRSVGLKFAKRTKTKGWRVCELYLAGRMREHFNKKIAIRIYRKIRRLHCNLLGILVSFANSNKYFLLATDNATRVDWIRYTKDKTVVTVVLILMEIIKNIEKETGEKVTIICADNGRSEFGIVFQNELKKLGFQFESFPLGKHSMNRVAEKHIQDISARSRSLLNQVGMPED
ncbi:hypothetical protein SBOR_9680 [Sclerotinia borealis F-4128]|uniref:Integrase catalytic domain-containing protein n=1 Tax=Sclerotinia borealis (strain F-4128) TaxID=1432307 RepID=W9C4V5_SCLBF|nr:hypothetical protein SBOR_9680 [Sclerotinia borealis F-4128]